MGSTPSRQFKSNIRVMGLADGPFGWEDEETLLVGVVVRLPGYVEALFTTWVAVDGDDATQKLATLVVESGYGGQLAAIMLKGASVAGFNIVRGSKLASQTGVPLVTVSRSQPHWLAIKAALCRHFPDWRARLALLEAAAPQPVVNGPYTLYCKGWGLEESAMGTLVQAATVEGALPEPLRLARLLARTMVRGHSRPAGPESQKGGLEPGREVVGRRLD